ncbi:exodeoxyribonuclease V subunit gamma [Sphaerotilus sp.]|uniref:exodeoxyribonuclease V subunit gamma n=1 Tax=Sphaerotilus sp. TaxID=2093942 RepID=UPI002ACE0B4A|nr:exodeoxyribonuclease V subunit gamma [Sphaerotilus sp.]MDZ7858044.1 exodeoxyribonuclease V subunit gamma [Sphaerotilus sp.]
MPEIERSHPAPGASHRSPITPGLLVLHGNRLELLQEAVFAWLERHPLDPLEQDVLLVQSNGIAEWMKMSLARRSGVCAATRVELPARFLWRLYRAMLGRDGAPARSPLDKAPMTWRLMQALPEWIGDAGFEPLAQFLAASPAADGTHDLGRRLQLAERLSDLYDQYQLYRADWLDAWARGREVLIRANGVAEPLPDDQRWQARLWCRLVDRLDPAGRRAVRSDVHRRFVAAVEAGDAPRQPLPRRVVLFGHSHLPWQTLQALAALSQRAQVLLAVPNPCQFHWADIIDGRELLRAPRQRHGHRRGVDLGALPLDQAHGQAHPLLAAWGRQGRDFLRLLDAFDDAETARQQFQIPRIDLFDEGDGDTLLAQVQSAVRDGLPLDELVERVRGGPPRPEGDRDRSIVFHMAHSAMREVEVLHDQLLHLLAHPGATPLAPRDIVVMLPDIEPYAPIIHAVFGQHGQHDPRHIPYEIADLRQRGRQPLLMAVEWLLRVTAQRCTASELRDLLEVPALARRFGLQDQDRATAARWLAGAGVRWGLDATQRQGLGLGACGEQNTGLFGLRRMLLGYACGRSDSGGAAPPWHAIEPYDEIGGLESEIAGALAGLIDALRRWWAVACTPASPAQWFQHAQALLQTFLDPADEDDRLMLASLHEALGRWLDDCEEAGFDAPVTLPVLREGWLAGVDEPSLNSRFLGGGVVFCTLMPMRAIPFEVVCLLGMNDGDYPRRAPRSDFDLMAQPGQHRPGDRARRDDDRMLMLEALLAARRVLSISWAGRSVRDNTPQPPSVLVSQLRDHLAAGWGEAVVARLTTEHPLQPFSRRYFEQAERAEQAKGAEGAEGRSALFTYAREWRQAHVEAPTETAALPPAAPRQLGEAERKAMLPLTLRRLENFLLNPVKDHFRERLGVVFQPLELAVADDEPFDLNALDETLLLRELLESPGAETLTALADCRADLLARTERLVRRGDLPVGGLGQRWRTQFVQQSAPMALQWNAWRRECAAPAQPRQVRAELEGLTLDDWLDDLRQAPGHDRPVWLTLDARRLCRLDQKTGALQPLAYKLVRPWLRMLVAGACGVALEGRIVARDAVLVLTPPRRPVAQGVLDDLLDVWQQGMLQPLPVACRTALAWLQHPDQPDKAEDAARSCYEGGHQRSGEGQDAALARSFPDWDRLREGTGFDTWAERLYEPLRAWVADPDCVAVQPLPDAEPGAEQDDEEPHDD